MNNNSWIKYGVGLGIVFFLAIYIIKPIGVSTQYSVFGGMIQTSIHRNVITVDETKEHGYKSIIEYYDRNGGKLAKAIVHPLNYDFVFVLSIPLGAFIGYIFTSFKKQSKMADVLERNDKPIFKQSIIRIYLPSFLSGFILLFGARMADGCTSGHMMSGIMQGSVSGYIFAITVFAVAIPVSILVEKTSKKRWS